MPMFDVRIGLTLAIDNLAVGPADFAEHCMAAFCRRWADLDDNIYKHLSCTHISGILQQYENCQISCPKLPPGFMKLGDLSPSYDGTAHATGDLIRVK